MDIKTLSPLHIGTQDNLELSPYTDYVLRDNKVYYVNKTVFLDAVQRAGRLDEYVKNIGQLFDNNRSNFSLGDFIESTLKNESNAGVSWNDVCPSYQHSNGLTSNMRVPISPTISTRGFAFLPGSSLKGAMRTAILYHWLCSDDGRKNLKQSFRHIERLKSVNEKRRQTNRRDFRRNRELDREMDRILRDVFNEEELFGKITESDAKWIRVGDSKPITDPKGVEVYLAERKRLLPQNSRFKRKESSIPQPRQAIKTGQHLSAALSILPSFSNSHLSYLKDRKKLITGINHLAEDTIDNEIYQLSMVLSERGEYERRAEKMIEFYETVLLPVAKSEDRILLRVGQGKTIYDNSLLLSLVYGDAEQKESEHYFRILREALFGLKEDKSIFPITRTVAPGDDVFGWVSVKLS